ncbi:hypothetical protein L6R50_15215 [Myxococcota bacterium]|nr:hypothetical protein [Myxococcota bacterium]
MPRQHLIATPVDAARRGRGEEDEVVGGRRLVRAAVAAAAVVATPISGVAAEAATAGPVLVVRAGQTGAALGLESGAAWATRLARREWNPAGVVGAAGVPVELFPDGPAADVPSSAVPCAGPPLARMALEEESERARLVLVGGGEDSDTDAFQRLLGVEERLSCADFPVDRSLMGALYLYLARLSHRVGGPEAAIEVLERLARMAPDYRFPSEDWAEGGKLWEEATRVAQPGVAVYRASAASTSVHLDGAVLPDGAVVPSGRHLVQRVRVGEVRGYWWAIPEEARTLVMSRGTAAREEALSPPCGGALAEDARMGLVALARQHGGSGVAVVERGPDGRVTLASVRLEDGTVECREAPPPDRILAAAWGGAAVRNGAAPGGTPLPEFEVGALLRGRVAGALHVQGSVSLDLVSARLPDGSTLPPNLGVAAGVRWQPDLGRLGPVLGVDAQGLVPSTGGGGAVGVAGTAGLRHAAGRHLRLEVEARGGVLGWPVDAAASPFVGLRLAVGGARW